MSQTIIQSSAINFINMSNPSIGGIGYLVKSIVGVFSSIALGVILFTLILKLVTLPFDFLSKRSMRKNSMLMEKMRPELEKLQRQYANDKMLYNQKMQALYKKNGYSLAGACLPTILTLVVFIIAINGFTTFANYQNKQYFYDMSVSYNQAFYDGFFYTGYDDNGNEIPLVYSDYIIVNENDKGEITSLTLDEDILQLDTYKATDIQYVNLPKTKDSTEKSSFYIFKTKENGVNYFYLGAESSYVTIKYHVSANNKFRKDSIFIREEKMENTVITGEAYDAYKTLDEQGKHTYAENFVKDIAATNSYNTYKGINNSFLWVKNIWVTDSATAHPIISNYNKFIKTYKVKTEDISQDTYNNLISKLSKEAKEPNGYFILVALTALSSLLMQIITSKSQKAQMELQTVDGQGAKSTKLMTWIMPIMMAVFAFTMTAAFSIYMITSSIFSILTTILINKIVDKSLKKKMASETEVSEGKEVIRGRVYVKEPPKPEPKKKKNKKEEDRVDFLKDKKENKKIRGRLK